MAKKRAKAERESDGSLDQSNDGVITIWKKILGVVITVGSILIAIGIAYGKLTQEVEDLSIRVQEVGKLIDGSLNRPAVNVGEKSHEEIKKAIEELHRKIDQLTIGVDSMTVEPYPNEDGEIATFGSAPGKYFSTSLGEQLSLLSDSARSGHSTVRYEWMPPDGGGEGDGYLRIHYHLVPDGDQQPYVGVYANFSNPVNMFDASRFNGVDLMVKAEVDQSEDIDVFFQLCDVNVNGNGNYAWAEYQIEDALLANNVFSEARPSYSDFKTPAVFSVKYPFAPEKVFRFIIKILGKAGKDVEGAIDVDEIRFRKQS